MNLLETRTRVGNCPKCGFPIYEIQPHRLKVRPGVWILSMSVSKIPDGPARVEHSCECFKEEKK